MAFSALAFTGLATFPGWHEERSSETGSDIDIKPFPSRRVSKLCCMALGMASFFLMVSALWQHIAAAAASTMASSATQDVLQGSVGPSATALIWISFVLTTIVLLAMITMILSIKLLDRLTDD